MRKSIFDIVAENNNQKKDVERIIFMGQHEKIIKDYFGKEYTLIDFVDVCCFSKWPHRNHCLDVDDYLKSLNYDVLKIDATFDIESMMTLIELMYNFWYLSKKYVFRNPDYYNCIGNYYHLKTVMDDILAQYNYMAYIDGKNNQVLVIEDKPEVTAAAEIAPDKLSLDVIRYNHKSLQGDIEAKRAILLRFGAELEPKRKKLREKNSTLEKNIFQMLNNLNIRHNNINENDSAKYRKYVADMGKRSLENWYDELYQMILLAFLLLDDVSREDRVGELLKKVAGG